MDEDQFNDFEEADAPSSTPPAPALDAVFSPSPASSPSGLPNVHPLPIYSLDSNPTDSSPLDFDGPTAPHSFWPQLGRMGSAHAPIDPSPLLDFHKNRSESEPKNQPLPVYEFASLLGEQDETRNELSVSSGGIGMDNYRSLGQVEYQVGSERKEEKPIENLFSSLESGGHPAMNLEIFSWEAPKEVKISPLSIGTNAFGLGEATNEFDMLGQAYQSGQSNLGSGVDMDFTSLAYNPLAMDTAATKPRTDSQDFEFVDTVPQPVEEKPQVIITETKAEQNDQPEIWEDFGSTPLTAYAVTIEQNVKTEKNNPVWSQQLVEPAAEDNRKESDEFEFQSTTPPQPTYTSPQPQAQQPQQIAQTNQSPPAVAEEQEDEFGDFQQTAQTPQAVEAEPVTPSNQANVVEVGAQYLQSYEADYYQQKQQELQKLVDNLPDYSYLFQQHFLE